MVYESSIEKCFSCGEEDESINMFLEEGDQLWCEKCVKEWEFYNHRHWEDGSPLMEIRVKKLDNRAVLPKKAHPDDACWDLTAISLIKKVDQVYFFDTGLAIQPPPGYYTKIYPRSSISKTYFSLANSTAIIDSGYTGPLVLALRKHYSAAPDFELPCRIAQLELCKLEKAEIVEVDKLNETVRSDKGFGSTGK